MSKENLSIHNFDKTDSYTEFDLIFKHFFIVSPEIGSPFHELLVFENNHRDKLR